MNQRINETMLSISNAGAQCETEEAEIAVGRGRRPDGVEVARVAAAPPDLADEARLHEDACSADLLAVFAADFQFADRQYVGLTARELLQHAIVDRRVVFARS